MANKKGTGLSMVWAEVPAEKEEDFNRFYNEEHLVDLLAVPGVLNAARYEAVMSGPKHLVCYELECPKVVESAVSSSCVTTPLSGLNGLGLELSRPT